MDTFLTMWLELLSTILLYIMCGTLTLCLLCGAIGVIWLMVELIIDWKGKP